MTVQVCVCVCERERLYCILNKITPYSRVVRTKTKVDKHVQTIKVLLWWLSKCVCVCERGGGGGGVGVQNEGRSSLMGDGERGYNMLQDQNQ